MIFPFWIEIYPDDFEWFRWFVVDYEDEPEEFIRFWGDYQWALLLNILWWEIGIFRRGKWLQ